MRGGKREGAGRKPTDTKQVTVRLHQWVKDWVVDRKNERKISLGRVIEELVEKEKR